MGIQHPLGVSPAPEYTLGYSCAFCGGAIPDQQPESYRGWCDTGCKAGDQQLNDAANVAARKPGPVEALITDADVNEAASRERMEALDLSGILPERIRRTLYEAGYNVETLDVAEDSSTCELRVRLLGQSAIVRIQWED